VESEELRGRLAEFLRARHTMTVATVATDGPEAGAPHAAAVWYAVDDRLRLVFLSKGSSRHGAHIKGGSRVAVTVADEVEDWRDIRGVQLWGRAEALSGVGKAGAFATYLGRFPFVRDLLREPRLAGAAAGLDVFRFVPERAAFTDNRRRVAADGLFGQEVLEIGEGGP
jgi:uncharacterized protein YhbP (UPF0306 family)